MWPMNYHVTHPTCPPSFIRIRPQLFEISCYISVSPCLSMVKNHFKNYQIRIRIQIFTKIESIIPCYTPNMSTKYLPNPSTTFWDIVLYIGLALSLNGEESLKHYQIRIQILIKIESILPCRTSNLSTTFWDTLHTNKQTEGGWKHNFLHLRWRR